MLANTSTWAVGEGCGAPGVLRGVVQLGDIEAPARQRFGIAVHDADARRADAVAREHRQRIQTRQQIGMPRRRVLKPGVYPVRALDHRGGHRIRIGAAASGVVGFLAQLGLDVSNNGIVR